jgi:FkbM family methyltransferase
VENLNNIMKKYFIDCGAHCGESILMAKQKFGMDIHVISFEPIPHFANQISEIYKDNDSVQISNSAIWINDKIKKIYVSTDITDGSSLLGNAMNNLKSDIYIEIPCVDLSSWILNTFTNEDYIILKLDIEGAEYEVLNKMIDDGSIKLIKELWGEWHIDRMTDDHSLDLSKKIYKYLKDNQLELKSWEIHIPTIGKSHPLLANRPKTLKNLI